MDAHPICQRLKSLREDRLGISTEAMAERIRAVGRAEGLTITGGSVSRYERNRVPRADYIGAVARVAGVSTDWLIHGEESDEAVRGAGDRRRAWADRLRALADQLEADYVEPEEGAPPVVPRELYKEIGAPEGAAARGES